MAAPGPATRGVQRSERIGPNERTDLRVRGAVQTFVSSVAIRRPGRVLALSGTLVFVRDPALIPAQNGK
jgi:hypothetical protein